MRKHFAVAVSFLVFAATGANAQGRTAINVNLFAGASAVPIYIAQDKQVFVLRDKYGEPKKQMGAVEKYVDLTYYNRAIGR